MTTVPFLLCKYSGKRIVNNSCTKDKRYGIILKSIEMIIMRMMSMKKKVKLEGLQSRDIYLLVPFIIAAAIVPLIVFMKVKTLTGIQFEYWTGVEQNVDFFSYYKSLWITIAGVFAGLVILYGAFKREIKEIQPVVLIGTGVYTLFVILSSLLSKYQDVAMGGFADRYEGMYVLIAYVLLMLGAIITFKKEKSIKILMIFIMISAAVICTIGLFQYLGHDFFKTKIGRLILLPKEYHHIADTLTFNFEPGRTYTTLYNPNYVGSYVALVLPICVGMAFYFKKIGLKLLSIALGVLLLVNLVGSQSDAGYIAVALSVVVFIVMFRKTVFKKGKKVVIACVGALLIFVAYNVLTGNSIVHYIENNITYHLLTSAKEEKSGYINDIEIKNDMVEIDTNTEILKLKKVENNISFYDESDQSLTVINDNGVITFMDNKYSEYMLILLDNGGIRIKIRDKEFFIYALEEGFKILGTKGKPDDIIYPEKIGFEGRERFASSRGYIWSRSIPMLKNTLLTGYGPDTFVIYFPQSDYVGKINGFGSVNQIVDKAHNLYLQISINTGVVSLLAFLVLLLTYFVTTVRVFWRRELNSFHHILGVSILVSIFGYCIAGIANDGNVSVSPVFWVLLGVGIAINRNIAKEKPVKAS